MMRATPYPTCIEVEPILAAPDRRAHRPGLARNDTAQDRPARDLHAPDGIARPRRDHAVPDHVPRQETGWPRLAREPARLGERPLFIGGCHSRAPTGPVSAAMFADSAPSRRNKDRRPPSAAPPIGSPRQDSPLSPSLRAGPSLRGLRRTPPPSPTGTFDNLPHLPTLAPTRLPRIFQSPSPSSLFSSTTPPTWISIFQFHHHSPSIHHPPTSSHRPDLPHHIIFQLQ